MYSQDTPLAYASPPWKWLLTKTRVLVYQVSMVIHPKLVIIVLLFPRPYDNLGIGLSKSHFSIPLLGQEHNKSTLSESQATSSTILWEHRDCIKNQPEGKLLIVVQGTRAAPLVVGRGTSGGGDTSTWSQVLPADALLTYCWGRSRAIKIG